MDIKPFKNLPNEPHACLNPPMCAIAFTPTPEKSGRIALDFTCVHGDIHLAVFDIGHAESLVERIRHALDGAKGLHPEHDGNKL